MVLSETSTTFKQPVDIAGGGTGATTESAARAKLGITPENIGAAPTSHGNHVPTIETADNTRFLRNDNTWATITPANIGAQPTGDYVLKSEIPVTSVNNKTGNVELTAYDVGAVRLNGSSTIAGNITLGSDTDTNTRTFALTKKANETSAIYSAQFAFSGSDRPMIAFYKDGAIVNYLSLGETSTTLKQPLDIASGGTGASTKSAARAELGITPENIGAQPAGDYALKSEIPVVDEDGANIQLLETSDIDNTLSKSGKVADAKAVGDALASLSDNIAIQITSDQIFR